jgi:cytochrome c-type biogenesis protein CcmH/NrfG
MSLFNEATAALAQVLRLNPKHDEARSLLNQATGRLGEAA